MHYNDDSMISFELIYMQIFSIQIQEIRQPLQKGIPILNKEFPFKIPQMVILDEAVNHNVRDVQKCFTYYLVVLAK